MDYKVILAFAGGMLLLYIAGKIFLVPLKMLLKLFFNALVGGIFLWVIDYFGSYIGLSIPINPITALIAGLLGVPGIILLIGLQYLIVK